MKPLNLIFMGTPDIAVPALRALHHAGHRVGLVITQPDRPAGRGRKLRRGPVAAAADALGLAVLQPRRAADARRAMAELAPDLLVTMAYGQILPPPLLELAPLGAVNVHTSLLPRLRGPAPINRAILRGLSETGVSTMYMDQAMDSGDIILQAATPIADQETAGSLFDRLAVMGAGLLVRTLEAMAAGAAPRIPQDHSQATYAAPLTKAEGRVDWRRPAAELDRHVRGMDPWPAAYSTLDGRMLKLYGPTRVLPEAGGAPGQVLARSWDDGELVVACGQGALALGQVQAAGKRRMAAGEFLRGARLAAGVVLGR